MDDLNKLLKLYKKLSNCTDKNCKIEKINFFKNKISNDISPNSLIKLSKKSKKEQEIKIQEIVNNKIHFNYMKCEYNKCKNLQKKLLELSFKILNDKKNYSLNTKEQLILDEFNKLINTKNLSNIQIKKFIEFIIKKTLLLYNKTK